MRHSGQIVRIRWHRLPDVVCPPRHSGHDILRSIPASPPLWTKRAVITGDAPYSERTIAVLIAGGVWVALGCIAEIIRLAQTSPPPL